MVAVRRPQLVCVSRASWTLGNTRRWVPNELASKTTFRNSVSSAAARSASWTPSFQWESSLLQAESDLAFEFQAIQISEWGGDCVSQRLANFFCKGPNSNIFKFVGHGSVLHLLHATVGPRSNQTALSKGGQFHPNRLQKQTVGQV